MKFRPGIRRMAVPLLLLSMVSVMGIAAIVEQPERIISALQKAFYLSAEEAVWIRPGLNVEIQDVFIRNFDRKPIVTFRISDEDGIALDREGLFTPGEVSTNFILAYIPQDSSQYVNYNTLALTSPITGNTEYLAFYDRGGTYTPMGDGVYQYTFASTLPAGYDRTATHTLGSFSTRDLEEFGLSFYVANEVFSFVPDGGDVVKIRDVVSTTACNQCHDPLNMHGGRLRDVKNCILCHQPQSKDPDTGNTLDMKVMIHKIHMGADLPSVEEGTPYQIGGGSNAHDFSDVEFPQDIRNCETCHRDSAQVYNWLLNPTMESCGSCHDDVNFETGELHAGGRQLNNNNCARCHWPVGDYEYDASIAGAHIPPYKSAQLRNPKFEILDVINTGPGERPTVAFRITDKDGNLIAPADMNRVRLYLAGPTSDYRWYEREDATGADYANGVATYTFETAIPEDATGSYAIVFEGRILMDLDMGTQGIDEDFRDIADNVAAYFSVTDEEPVPRRSIVSVDNCNECHEKLRLHGGNRTQVEACVVCHNPTATDEADPGESIDFKTLIHKIHTGEELEYDYVIDDNSFNHVAYPGDRRNCLKCHEGNSFTVPLPSNAIASTTPQNFWSPTLPTAAACLGCHDGISTAAHAFVNTAFFGESCEVCHKESAEFGVSKVHAR